MNSNERFQNSVDSTASLSPELKEFKRELDAAFANEDSANPSVIENSDRIHNSLIMSSLFENSTDIDMFCGEMSVFRKGFYDYVQKNNEAGDSDYCISRFSRGLKSFLAKTDSSLNIYVENWKSSLLDDLYPVKDEFLEALREKKIMIYKEKAHSIGLPKGMAHITMGDKKWIRVEYDRNDHKGTFVVPSSELTQSSSRNFFKNLAILTEPIDVCK